MHRMFIFALVVIMATSVHSQQQKSTAFSSPTISGLKAYLEKSRQDLTALAKTKYYLMAEYDSNVILISQLKEKKELGFFERIQLKSLLKQSEDISQQMVKIDKLTLAHYDTNKEKLEQLVRLMEDEIRAVLRQIEQSPQGSDERGDFVETLQAMILEKLEMQSQAVEPLTITYQEIRHQKTDDPEVLIEKSDYLMDQHDKLVRYIEQIDRKIDLIESENEIKKQARRFVDDVYLLDKNREMKITQNKNAESGGTLLGGAENLSRAASQDEMLLRTQSLTGITATSSQNPLFLNSRLELSNQPIYSTDDFQSIIQKLNVERRLAQNKARHFKKISGELRRLAEYKLRYGK